MSPLVVVAALASPPSADPPLRVPAGEWTVVFGQEEPPGSVLKLPPVCWDGWTELRLAPTPGALALTVAWHEGASGTEPIETCSRSASLSGPVVEREARLDGEVVTTCRSGGRERTDRSRVRAVAQWDPDRQRLRGTWSAAGAEAPVPFYAARVVRTTAECPAPPP